MKKETKKNYYIKKPFGLPFDLTPKDTFKLLREITDPNKNKRLKNDYERKN